MIGRAKISAEITVITRAAAAILALGGGLCAHPPGLEKAGGSHSTVIQASLRVQPIYKRPSTRRWVGSLDDYRNAALVKQMRVLRVHYDVIRRFL